MTAYTQTRYRMLNTLILFFIGIAFSTSLIGLHALMDSGITIRDENRINVSAQHLLLESVTKQPNEPVKNLTR